MSAGRQLKNRYRKSGSKISLKAFANHLRNEGDEMAIEWFLNKTPASENLAKEARMKLKGTKIHQEKVASREARKRGGKQQGKSTTTQSTTFSKSPLKK